MSTATVVNCTHCGQEIINEPRLAGQPVACPKCHATFVMPGAVAPAYGALSRRPAKSKVNFRATMLVAVGGCAAAIVAVAVALAAWAITRNDRSIAKDSARGSSNRSDQSEGPVSVSRILPVPGGERLDADRQLVLNLIAEMNGSNTWRFQRWEDRVRISKGDGLELHFGEYIRASWETRSPAFGWVQHSEWFHVYYSPRTGSKVAEEYSPRNLGVPSDMSPYHLGGKSVSLDGKSLQEFGEP